MIGHSLGEIAALYASGMLDLKSAVALVGRGHGFRQYTGRKPWTFDEHYG